MKTGLGLQRKIRKAISYYNLLRFWLRRFLIGFDYANLLLQRVDKLSTELILKKNGAKIGEHCDIETGLVFHNCNDYTNLFVGDYCHIGKNCFFDLREKVIIENNVVISMQCTFITHIDMSKTINMKSIFPTSAAPIVVKKDSYIGANSTILKGVTLGEKSFVAAYSLVNKNVDSLNLVGGVPAKLLKKLDSDLINGK